MDRKILKVFNYECYQDRIVRVICPLFKKTVALDFVYILSSAYCYVHTQLFLDFYMCVFILNGFPLWLFLELDSLLWNIVLEVSGPFYNLITRNYATNFNMNFLEVSLLL